MTEILDERTFFTHIKDDLCVVYFSSDTCLDCDYLKPYISSIEKLFNVSFYSVKRHNLSELFKQYKIYGVPSFIIFNRGEVLASWIDKNRKEPKDIIVFLDRYLNRM